MYWRRNLTRLEIGIYAAVVGVVLAVFLERVLYYMELAERTAMEVTVSNVNSAINVQRAFGMLAGRAIDNPSAPPRNPFTLAEMAPANFIGEVDSPDLASLERGQWVFDRTRRELIYLPRLRQGLATSDPDGAIRFKLDPRGNTISALVPAAKYTWN